MSSYWQGKGAGKRIGIRFDKPLLGDVTGLSTPVFYATITPPGTPTASGQYSATYSPDKAFDGSTSTFWYIRTTGDQWIQIELLRAQMTNGFRWYIGSSYRPNGFTVQGSNDGESWTNIYSDNSANTTGWKEFFWDPAGPFKFYRWTVTSRHSTYLYIYEIELSLGAGNEAAFSVTGLERDPLKYGTPKARAYAIQSVERYPLTRYWQDDFSGDMEDVEIGANGVGLEQEMGNALGFDGVDDYVDCGNDSSLNITSKLTLEAYIKSDGYTSWPRIVTKEGAYGLYFREQDHDHGLAFYGSGVDTYFPTKVNVNDGEWHHVAAVYDGSKITGYVDGVSVGTIAKSGDLSTVSIAFTIGNRPDKSRPFKGTIDDVRIWNTARTQQQIADNMNRELAGDEQGLIGYWKLNEGAGATAYDSAGSNNGTIYGATWTDGIIGSYPDEGTYTLSLDATELPESPRFRCEASTPDDTAIITEYACTAGDEPDSGDWAEIEDGDLLTITDDTLWLRYTLTTDDPAVTPTLLSAWLEEPTAPPGTILLTMAPDSRFNDVEGDLTISYERAKGTLTGTRPVEDFTESFTPTGLEPTPLNVQGTITAGIEVEVDFIEVYYVDLGHKNTITAGITVEVDLIPVSEIPP